MSPDAMDLCLLAAGRCPPRVGPSFRYAELGCGGAFSLAGLAALHPEASFTGIDFMPEPTWGKSNRWLTTLTIDPDHFGSDREDVRKALEAENIEARPVWKPMHRQPVFAGYASVGGAVADGLFERGLCLPSGSSLSNADRGRVIDIVHKQYRPR